MTDSNKKRNTILVQGSIFAVASLISRIIGLIYRVPLTSIIGKTGNDYYGTAYTVYNIVLIFSSYSIPLAVSKLVSARMAKHEYENARRVFRGSLIFAIVTGGIGMVIVFFGAGVFTSWLKTPMSTPALKILAPVILMVAIVGVLRGFFQGLNTMIPSSISQIIEQIMNAVVSVVAAFILFGYGSRVGAVLGNKDKYAAAYGASGGTLGTFAGSLAALIFMIFIHFLYRKVFKRKLKKQRNVSVESYRSIFIALILTIIPVILSTAVYNSVSILETYIFKNIATLQTYSEHQISTWWGVYTGEVSVLKNIPISIASAMAASSVPAITASFNKNDKAEVEHQITSATRFISIIALPCTVGMIVLANPILKLLFHDPDNVSAYMLMFGALSIPFFCISTLTNGLLQGINKMSEPVKNALLALVLYAVFLIFTLEVLHLNIYGVLISLVFYGFMMCILNRRALNKYSKIKQDIFKTYVLPLIASIIMGIFVYLGYQLMNIATHSNAISTLFAILVGIFTYFISIVKIHGITENEMRRFPKGEMLVKFANKLHLL